MALETHVKQEQGFESGRTTILDAKYADKYGPILGKTSAMCGGETVNVEILSDIERRIHETDEEVLGVMADDNVEDKINEDYFEDNPDLENIDFTNLTSCFLGYNTLVKKHVQLSVEIRHILDETADANTIEKQDDPEALELIEQKRQERTNLSSIRYLLYVQCQKLRGVPEAIYNKFSINKSIDPVTMSRIETFLDQMNEKVFDLKEEVDDKQRKIYKLTKSKRNVSKSLRKEKGWKNVYEQSNRQLEEEKKQLNKEKQTLTERVAKQAKKIATQRSTIRIGSAIAVPALAAAITIGYTFNTPEEIEVHKIKEVPVEIPVEVPTAQKPALVLDPATKGMYEVFRSEFEDRYRFPQDFLFRSAQTNIKPDYKQYLDQVVNKIDKKLVVVEGYTDPVPLRRGSALRARHKNLHGLSSARAFNVARYVSKENPDILVAYVGKGADNPVIVEDGPNKGNIDYAKSRRVELMSYTERHMKLTQKNEKDIIRYDLMPQGVIVLKNGLDITERFEPAASKNFGRDKFKKRKQAMRKMSPNGLDSALSYTNSNMPKNYQKRRG